MTRVHSLAGPTYRQLVAGLGILAVAVGLASLMAVALIMTWSRHVAGIVGVLTAQNGGEVQALQLTGERELDHIVEALNDARRRLIASHERTDVLARQVATGERLAAIGRVTAGVAHGFRNPLAAMRLKAEMALKGSPERKEQALALVIGQVDRLDGIIGRLLTVSEHDSLRCESVALAPYLAACITPHQAEASARGVSLTSTSTVATGWFDADRMSHALHNLIVNALQEKAPGAIVLAAEREADRLILSVSDGGEGPPPSIRDHLFDPFVSGDPERAGLGLAIVREISAAHDGQVDLSRVDGRTTVRIVLPCPAF